MSILFIEDVVCTFNLTLTRLGSPEKQNPKGMCVSFLKILFFFILRNWVM